MNRLDAIPGRKATKEENGFGEKLRRRWKGQRLGFEGDQVETAYSKERDQLRQRTGTEPGEPYLFSYDGEEYQVWQ